MEWAPVRLLSLVYFNGHPISFVDLQTVFYEQFKNVWSEGGKILNGIRGIEFIATFFIFYRKAWTLMTATCVCKPKETGCLSEGF